MTVHVAEPAQHGKGDVWCGRCIALDVEGATFPLVHTAQLAIGGVTFDGRVSHGGVAVEPCGGLIHVDAVQTPPYKRVTLALMCDGCAFNRTVRGKDADDSTDPA